MFYEFEFVFVKFQFIEDNFVAFDYFRSAKTRVESRAFGVVFYDMRDGVNTTVRRARFSKIVNGG